MSLRSKRSTFLQMNSLKKVYKRSLKHENVFERLKTKPKKEKSKDSQPTDKDRD